MMALYAHLWNYRAESTDCEIYYAAALHIELFSTNFNCTFSSQMGNFIGLLLRTHISHELYDLKMYFLIVADVVNS